MRILIFIIICFLQIPLIANEQKMVEVLFLDDADQVVSKEQVPMKDFESLNFSEKKPNPVFQLFRKKHRLNKRITAAVLAFPLPFGIVGLHRIYLGTKPYVPVAYIASVGGAFGILPFIDFCAISFGKDFDHFRDNGKVFMWIKD